ncbi:hypothetical protein CRE_17167 [Caenorhabditis remanei]|uniref:Uncharacterized protein n=1 Tax=Caenorhabditis remanei TaxID=31234 RepID=E3MAH4_CAERE|nr:hypothetical protein CRE_17167 [Caenorhabditis remanei]
MPLTLYIIYWDSGATQDPRQSQESFECLSVVCKISKSDMQEFRLSFSAGYKLVEEKITYMDKGWERNKTNPYMDCKDIFNNKLKALDYIDLRFKRELMEFELLIIQIENLLKKEDNKMATETNEWKELIDKAKKIQLSDDLITLPREKHNASDFYPIYNTFTKKVELTTFRKIVLKGISSIWKPLRINRFLAHASQQDLAFEFLLFLYKIRELTLVRYNVSCRFLHKEDENWNILITTRTSISVLQIERRRSNNDILPRNSLLFKCVGDTVEMTKHEDIHDNVYYDIHLRGQPEVPTFAAKITDAFEVLLVKIFETTELSANRDVVLRKKWYER